jgi:hypothetical protein
MITLADRIARDGITSTATPVRRDRDAEGWDHDLWSVTLERGAAAGQAPFVMTVPYRMGIGHHGAEPDAVTVLSSLLMDASSVENAGASFEDWANEYGYDPDSRKAEKIFRACIDQTVRLREFLGDLFGAYVWETEID